VGREGERWGGEEEKDGFAWLREGMMDEYGRFCVLVASLLLAEARSAFLVPIGGCSLCSSSMFSA